MQKKKKTYRRKIEILSETVHNVTFKPRKDTVIDIAGPAYKVSNGVGKSEGCNNMEKRIYD